MPILPASILLLLAGAQAGQDIPARLLDPGPIKPTEISSLMGYLESPNPKVRVAALEFWGKRNREILYTKVAAHSDKKDGDEISKFCENVVKTIDAYLSENDFTIAASALRTLCLMEDDPSLRGICGLRFYEPYSHYISFNAKGRDSRLIGLLHKWAEGSELSMAFPALCFLHEDGRALHRSLLRNYLLSKDEEKMTIGLIFFEPQNDKEAYYLLDRVRNNRTSLPSEAVEDTFHESLKSPAEDFAMRASWKPWARIVLARKLGESEILSQNRLALQMIDDPDTDVRLAAISAASSSNEDQLLSDQRVRELFRDKTPSIRRAALYILIKREVPDIREIITTALKDPDNSVAEDASEYCDKNFDLFWTDLLESSAIQHSHVYIGRDYFWRPENQPRLSTWIKSPNIGLRGSVAHSMSDNYDSSRFRKHMYGLLNDEAPGIFYIALKTLTEHEALSFDAVVKQMREGSLTRNKICVSVLADHFELKEHEAFFIPLLDSHDPSILTDAMSALCSISDKNEKLIIAKAGNLKGKALATFLGSMFYSMSCEDPEVFQQFINDEDATVKGLVKVIIEFLSSEDRPMELIKKIDHYLDRQ